MEDEEEALQAIFDSDFTATVDPKSARPRWCIALPEHGVTLVTTLPEGYPATEAPTPSLEFEHWPAGGDDFARRMVKELPALWQAGEACIYQWVEHLKEALESGGLTAAGSAAAAVGPVAADEAAADAATAAGPVTVPLPAELGSAAPVESALTTAGFLGCGPGVFSRGDRGVTVEVSSAEVCITVDGIDMEDLTDWATMQLAANVGTFGVELLQWVTAQRSAEPGFLEDGGASAEQSAGLDFLPAASELGVDKERELLIYTWGKALRKCAPGDSEYNFNAGILNGRGGGADLRTMNGLSDEVQSNVASCGLFPRWVSMVCAKVEHSDLHCISINCTKGRHRSVAAAEIVRKFYYPRAQTKHLTIY